MSPLSSVDNTLPLYLFLCSSTMSDIYCDEDVMDFTNPFLDYKQGHRSVTRKIAAIPVSPKTILPEQPLTRRGYPRGESHTGGEGLWKQVGTCQEH